MKKYLDISKRGARGIANSSYFLAIGGETVAFQLEKDARDWINNSELEKISNRDICEIIFFLRPFFIGVDERDAHCLTNPFLLAHWFRICSPPITNQKKETSNLLMAINHNERHLKLKSELVSNFSHMEDYFIYKRMWSPRAHLEPPFTQLKALVNSFILEIVATPPLHLAIRDNSESMSLLYWKILKFGKNNILKDFTDFLSLIISLNAVHETPFPLTRITSSIERCNPHLPRLLLDIITSNTEHILLHGKLKHKPQVPRRNGPKRAPSEKSRNAPKELITAMDESQITTYDLTSYITHRNTFPFEKLCADFALDLSNQLRSTFSDKQNTFTLKTMASMSRAEELFKRYKIDAHLFSPTRYKTIKPDTKKKAS